MDESSEKNQVEYFKVHKKIMYLILLLPIIILGLILFFRNKFYSNIYINEISYKTILEINIFNLKEMAHIHELYLPIINIALAVLCVFILYIIIVDEKNKIDKFTSVISIIIYIISPIFIFTFSTINRFAFIIPLALLLFYLYRNKKYLLSIAIFTIICMIDIISSSVLIISILLFNYKDTIKQELAKKKDNKDNDEKTTIIIVPFIIMGIIILLGWTYAIISLNGIYFIGMPQNYSNIVGMNILDHNSYNHLENYLLESGTDFGIAFIGIILLIIGIHNSWKYKKQYAALYITLSLFLLLSIFYNIQYLLVSGVIICIFNAKGIEKIKKITWHFGELKKLSYIIIAVALIISCITFSISHINSSPNKPLEKSVDIISSYFSSSGVSCSILTDDENKYFIQYVTGMEVITEDDEDITKILDKRNENDVINTLNDKDVCIIMSDAELKKDMTDEKNLIGLEFIMENGNGFEKIYTNKDYSIDIWRFRYSTAFSDDIPIERLQANKR